MKDKYIIVTDGCSFIDNNLIKKPPFKKIDNCYRLLFLRWSEQKNIK